MLAATIAFSPVLTTGVVSPVQVEAAGTSTVDVDKEINTLAKRFFIFYKHANFSTPAAINTLTYDQIKSQSTKLSVPSEKQDEFVALVKNISTLIYTDYNNEADLA